MNRPTLSELSGVARKDILTVFESRMAAGGLVAGVDQRGYEVAASMTSDGRY